MDSIWKRGSREYGDVFYMPPGMPQWVKRCQAHRFQSETEFKKVLEHIEKESSK
jgi:hypothetical protein